jgi:CubicO group peptidase (beta-lactamase class C family)
MTCIARRLPALALAATLAASLNACTGGEGGGGPVGPAPIAVVAISGGVNPLTPGQSTQLVASASTAGGQVVSDAQFTWLSETPAVATVDGAGKVTAVSAGTAAVKATAGDVHGTTTITVQAPPDPLTAIVESVRSAFNMPAMGAAIVTLDGGVTAVAAAGKRRVTGGSAVNTDDLWHIGSNTKAMTALLAAVAVTEGRIQWTTTIPQIFPNLPVSQSYVDVTLRDLLSHQSGFLNAISPVAAVVNAPTVTDKRLAAVGWAVQQPPHVPKGTFYYSNAGYVVATAMLERVFGTSYEAAIAAHIYTPLGVTGAGWGVQATPGSVTQPGAHALQNGTWTVLENLNNPPPWAYGAGGMYMSLASWGRLIREVLRVEANVSTVASSAEAQQTTSHVIAVEPSVSYGMGWYVQNVGWATGKAIYHDGTNTGNHSLVYVAPLRNVAFLVTTNGFDPNGHSLAAMEELIARLEAFYSAEP